MLWDSNLIARLLELYKENRILWDQKHQLYSDKSMKNFALEGIAEELGVPVSAADIDRKYKTMRAAYQVEVRKIHAGKLRGFYYKPMLHWFDTFNRFVEETNKIKNREGKTSGLPTNDVKTVRIREDAKPYQRKKSQKIVWTQSPRDSKKRLSVRVVSTESAPRPEHVNLKLLEESSEESDDEFQTFADHIAEQLKTMSVHRAVMIQNQIQKLFARDREMYDEEEIEETEDGTYY